jgi:hypothetical protein
MPAVSKRQQRSAGMAYAAKMGQLSPKKLKGSALRMYQNMNADQLKGYAQTDTRYLPNRKRPRRILKRNA